MTGDKIARPGPPRTLKHAHEELVRVRPSPDASLAAWLAYYRQSAALYAEVAEIDRGHHHECLYWAERERVSAEKTAARIRAEGRK
ncbi:MAG: hypothetical protein LC808_32870 [Actinobacteria bacterium]|nr:hypothetical protein [Actinomycetota bacterium]